MTATSSSLFQKMTWKAIFIDIVALAFIYLVPTISHLLSVPIYLIDPMRLMLILAIVHSNKANGYILALTMPVFSMIISGHPAFPKMILIAIELAMNVFLFYLLLKKLKQPFLAIFLSIVMSKILYYLLKYFLIQLTIIHTELISTPIFIQLITTAVFSIYLMIFLRRADSGN